MAYEVVMPYHLHMPSYFLETFTEYPVLNISVVTLQGESQADHQRIRELHKSNSLFLYLNCIGLRLSLAQFENLGELGRL